MEVSADPSTHTLWAALTAAGAATLGMTWAALRTPSEDTSEAARPIRAAKDVTAPVQDQRRRFEPRVPESTLGAVQQTS